MARTLHPRVYWHRNQWQYKAIGEERKSLKAWTPLGSDDLEATKKYLELRRRMGGQSLVRDMLDDYLSYVMSEKDLAPATIRTKRDEIRMINLVFGDMEPGDITSRDVKGYYKKRKKQSLVQANHETSCLSQAFEYAIWESDDYAVEFNPVRGLPKDKPKPRDRLPTLKDIQGFKKHGTEFDRAVADFVYMIGAPRRQDILNLTRNQIKDGELHIKTSKTGKKGSVLLTPDLEKVIEGLQSANPRRLINAEGYLVLGPDGKRLKERTYNDRIRKAMMKALKAGDVSERFNIHDLRATAATEIDERGDDASAQLLHGDNKTTKIYLRSKKVPKLHLLQRPK